MYQHLKLATLACTGVALGAGLAWTVPTEPRTRANAELERLSQVHVVVYPNSDQTISGPDSYPVQYSPQWLAVKQAAESARLARLGIVPPAQPVGYEPPLPERDLAAEREDAESRADEPRNPDAELAEAEAPTS